MQSTLETLGQLERRLSVAVPLREIEGEVGKRLARLAKTVKLPGFRPGKVPIKLVEQQYGPQVRSDVISDAVQSSFNEAVREQNLRVAGMPAHRALEQRGARAGHARVRRGVRDLSGSEDRRHRELRDRAPAGRGHARRRRPHARRAAPPARGVRAGRARRRDRRPRAGRLLGHDRRRRVRRRPGQGLHDHAGRGPHAARVRGGARRHEGRRDEDVSADVPGRLSRQGRGGKDRASSR